MPDMLLFCSTCYNSYLFFYSQGDIKSNEIASEDPENEPKVIDISSPSNVEVDAQIIDQLPHIEVIGKSFHSLLLALLCYVMTMNHLFIHLLIIYTFIHCYLSLNICWCFHGKRLLYLETQMFHWFVGI